MKLPTAPILLAALLLGALVPAALAAPIAQVAVGTFWYEWSTGTTAGRCASPSDTIVMEGQQVNSRLLLSIASGKNRAHQTPLNLVPSAMLPDANCPLQVTAAPGVFVNPCAVLAGQLSTPVVTSDPYFYQDPIWTAWWEKRVTFADGGYVYYSVGPGHTTGALQLPANHLIGHCAAPGGAHAEFRSYDMFVVAGPP